MQYSLIPAGPGRPSSRFDAGKLAIAAEWAIDNLPPTLTRPLIRHLTDARARVLDVMLRRCNYRGQIRISSQQAANLAQVAPRSFFNVLSWLEKAGILEKRESAYIDGTRREINLYTFSRDWVIAYRDHAKARAAARGTGRQGESIPPVQNMSLKDSAPSSTELSSKLPTTSNPLHCSPADSPKGASKRSNDRVGLRTSANRQTKQHPPTLTHEQPDPITDSNALDGSRSVSRAITLASATMATDSEAELIAKSLDAFAPVKAEAVKSGDLDLIRLAEQLRQEFFPGFNPLVFWSHAARIGLPRALMAAIEAAWKTHSNDYFIHSPRGYLAGILKKPADEVDPAASLHGLLQKQEMADVKAAQGKQPPPVSTEHKARLWIRSLPEEEQERLYFKHRYGTGIQMYSGTRECAHWQIRAWRAEGPEGN